MIGEFRDIFSSRLRTTSYDAQIKENEICNLPD